MLWFSTPTWPTERPSKLGMFGNGARHVYNISYVLSWDSLCSPAPSSVRPCLPASAQVQSAKALCCSCKKSVGLAEVL